ncbi:MAG: V-type ATP synthase subunit F [Planctomycetota bacterium]|jgi:vacuolar-type H+-ATPase subunit F/Vma7
MEGKVAVLGNSDFVMPFSALGLDTFATTEQHQQIVENAARIIEGKYILVVVAENVAPATQQAFAAQLDLPTPCIVIVPFTTEPTGFATRSLNKVLKMATGTDILQTA